MAVHLGFFWFVLMAGVGCFYPFYGLYFRQDLGFTATQIGAVIAMQPVIGLVAQPLWGQIADRTGSRRRALALALCGFGLGAFLVSRASTFAEALLAIAFMATCSSSLMSMSVAVSMASLPTGTHGFGRVRMFGTLGYLVAVIVIPGLTTFLASDPGSRDRLTYIFPLTLVLALPAAFLVLRLPPLEALGLRSRPGDFRHLLRHPPIRRLLVFAFCSNLAMQGPINLFPVLLAGRGGTVEDLRLAWIFMLALEIPLVGFAGATLKRLGPRGLLLMGLLAEAVRWIATAVVPSLETTLFLQIFHGLSAMGVLIGIPLYLELSVPARLRSTGQTVISAGGLGLGSITSIFVGGYLYDAVGSQAPYLTGGLVALTLAGLLFVLLPAPYRPEEDEPEPAGV